MHEARLAVLARQLHPTAAPDSLRHDGSDDAPAIVIGGLVMDIQVP